MDWSDLEWRGMDEPAADPHDLLANITPATERLVGALDDAGLIRQMRQAPTCLLQGLDRGLPRRPLEDLLAAIEAFTLVTGPTALAQADHATLQREAWRLLATLQGIERATRKRARAGRSPATTVTVNSALLREAFAAPVVQQALRSLIDAFVALTDLGVGEQSRRRGLAAFLPLGARFLMPGAVLAVALALVVVLLSSVLSLSRDARTTSQGAARTTASHLAKATATTASRSKSGAAATATPPSVAPTATSVAPPPQMVAVSPLDQTPCTDAHFTVTYSSGSGAVNWSAAVSNPANVVLSVGGGAFVSQVSGSLAPGQQALVTVRAQPDNFSQINVTTSAGPFTVTVDSTGC